MKYQLLLLVQVYIDDHISYIWIVMTKHLREKCRKKEIYSSSWFMCFQFLIACYHPLIDRRCKTGWQRGACREEAFYFMGARKHKIRKPLGIRYNLQSHAPQDPLPLAMLHLPIFSQCPKMAPAGKDQHSTYNPLETISQSNRNSEREQKMMDLWL